MSAKKNLHRFCYVHITIYWKTLQDVEPRFLMQTDRSVSFRGVVDNDHWLVMPRDYRPEEETYSRASRESDRNWKDMLHRLTRIRLQRAI
jgi:hypothetical protein